MRQIMKRGSALLAIGAAVVSMITVAIADERSERLDREATSIYQQVFSPFCPGRSLNDCPSSKASELKDELRAKLESGSSAEEILREVFERYGDQYRAVPLFAGVGILVWLAPISFVALGLLIAVRVAKGAQASPSVAKGSEPSSITPEAARRIQEELSKLD